MMLVLPLGSRAVCSGGCGRRAASGTPAAAEDALLRPAKEKRKQCCSWTALQPLSPQLLDAAADMHRIAAAAAAAAAHQLLRLWSCTRRMHDESRRRVADKF
jgi:hypothetical protein